MDIILQIRRPVRFWFGRHGGSPHGEKVQFTVAALCWATEVLFMSRGAGRLKSDFKKSGATSGQPEQVADGEAKTHGLALQFIVSDKCP